MATFDAGSALVMLLLTAAASFAAGGTAHASDDPPAVVEAPRKAASLAEKPAGEAGLEAGNQDFETYLDRLMMAESDGRDYLRNPRSTALGAYQFIKGTFLYVVRRHFQDDIAGKSEAEVLAMRTDRAFSRKVIAQYTRELAQHLDSEGLPATYGNLRLAYLLGPSGATRVLKAPAERPLARVISAAAIDANPFMAAMTAGDIIARARREIAMDPKKRLAVERARRKSGPRIKVRCNLQRPSCRRWLFLQQRKLRRKQRQVTRN